MHIKQGRTANILRQLGIALGKRAYAVHFPWGPNTTNKVLRKKLWRISSPSRMSNWKLKQHNIYANYMPLLQWSSQMIVNIEGYYTKVYIGKYFKLLAFKNASLILSNHKRID